jgi:hypothetical protein
MDLSTVDLLSQSARNNAEETNRLIPTWAEANPILRVVSVTITEDAF